MSPDEDAAFEAFTRERARSLFRTALLLTGGDWHLAEDLVQEALLRLYRFWPRVRPAANPAGYAQSVLTRVFLSSRRARRSTELPVASVGDALTAAVEPPDTAESVALFAALRRLTPADRAVLVLRFYADRSVEQVAADLGRTPSAVRTHSHRALNRLRDVIEPDLNRSAPFPVDSGKVFP